MMGNFIDTFVNPFGEIIGFLAILLIIFTIGVNILEFISKKIHQILKREKPRE